MRSNCPWSHIAIVASLCCWVWDQNVSPFTDKRLPGGGSGAGKVPNNANLAPGCNRLAHRAEAEGKPMLLGEKLKQGRIMEGCESQLEQYKNKIKSPISLLTFALDESVQCLWSLEKKYIFVANEWKRCVWVQFQLEQWMSNFVALTSLLPDHSTIVEQF